VTSSKHDRILPEGDPQGALNLPLVAWSENRQKAERRAALPASRGSAAFLRPQVVDDPEQCRHCVRIPKVSGVLIRLGLAIVPLTTKGIDHALEFIDLAHPTRLVRKARRRNILNCRRPDFDGLFCCSPAARGETHICLEAQEVRL
jgi:hypothetical protein